MIVLVDSPDDGMDELGWVSADAPIDAAREALRPLLIDPDVMVLLEPRRVWLMEPAGEENWLPCGRDDEGAIEFWEFQAADVADERAAALDAKTEERSDG